MSYDLYFYRTKGRQLDETAIGRYLTDNLVVPQVETQWFFENEDTGVYYSFDLNEPNDDAEAIEWYESFPDFENTRFSFNLNFLRPNFFGLEAFAFVERFVSDLDLYVLDDQNPNPADSTPTKQTATSLYENWSRTNLEQSAIHSDEFGLRYYPLDKSNAAWRYNVQKAEFQAQLGDDYFVPTLMFAARGSTGEVITVSTWTQHIPTVFPPADYFALVRERRKLLRSVQEIGILSGKSLLEKFEEYLEDSPLADCKMIHSDAAQRAGQLFNSIEFEYPLDGFFEPIELESITNAQQDHST